MTKRKLVLIATSLAIAMGLVGAKMLVAPVVSEAATNPGIDSEKMMLALPKTLPSFEDRYQRHTGVLDTLKTP